MLAIVDAYRHGLLARRHWLPNIVSGITVGVVALPLAMAFAIASGAKPEQGLYTAIIAGLVVSTCGGSRLQIAGPTGAFIVILSGITATHGIEGLQIATLMAGVMVVLLGLARLGAIIRFIPAPVILGFTAGIGLIIFVGQWQDFFGLPAPAGSHFHEQLPALLMTLPGLHPATTLLAAASLLVVIYASRIPGLKRIPGPLAALIFATALQSMFEFDGVRTIGTAFGGVPAGLPTVQVPEVSAARVIELMGPAFTIAMLCAIESLLSAVVADGMAGTRHDSNQELVGQGLANIAAPFFGGFAATGAIARTATNVRNGGTSPLAGIVHSVTLVLVILFLAPLAVNVPLAALAAILFVVAWNMSEVRRFVHMVRRAPRADVAILLVTFGLTVFVDLVVAVNIGVILATLHFLRRMSASVEVQAEDAQELHEELAARGAGPLPPDVLVYKVEGPFFFGAVENFERALNYTHTDPRVLILRLRWVPFMHITGVQALEEAIGDLQRRGVRVMITGANPRVTEKLDKAGVIRMVGPGNFCGNIIEALEKCREPVAPQRQSLADPAAACRATVPAMRRGSTQTSMDCTIGLATDADAERIAPLFDAYRQFYGLPSDLRLCRQYLAERLGRNESVVLLAGDADGCALGFVQMYPGFSSLSVARTYVLYDLFVDPAARQRGVGRRLMEAAAEEARRRGAVSLTLSTARTNVAAQRLYESLGWVRDEEFYEYNLRL